jgi:hypothetical protein
VNRCLLYAAVARKDTKEYQRWFSNGKCAFKSLRGMTLWAAYSNFEEKEKKSGKVNGLIL